MPAPFLGIPGGEGDATRAAFDFFGVDPSLVTDVFENPVPKTRTRTSHGLLIKVAGGRVIGAVQGFNHSQSRDLEAVFDVEADAKGYGPADLVPGNVTTRSISITRYDLWQRPCEEAFGTGFEYVNLADQARPFALRTTWRSPVTGGVLIGGRRVYEYTGCYFSRIGRQASVTDSRIVRVDAEITYVGRRRIA